MHDHHNLSDSLPGDTKTLVDVLDKLVKEPVVDPSDNLSDPAIQRRLYKQAGRRELVNELRAGMRRTQERSNGTL